MLIALYSCKRDAEIYLGYAEQYIDSDPTVCLKYLDSIKYLSDLSLSQTVTYYHLNPSVIVPITFVSLGEKLENPYSVANMKKAFSKLSPQTRSGVEDMEIKANRGRYTGIVEDLINGANITRNSIYYFANDKQWNKSEKSYLDRVSGYSLKQIENALAGAETWERWRDNIKGISNNTRHYVDEAFSFWNSGK